MLRGTEYFPVPANGAGSSVVVVAGRGKSATVKKVAPPFQAPYLQSLRVSREVVIYKPPPFIAARFQPGRLPPVISVQTELNASNFHEVLKNALVDPETQLTPPAWELRTPSPEELVAEKEFEAEESIWDDEYWREVAKYRQRLEITPKIDRTSGFPRRAAPSSVSQERSFQRGDSFRVEPKLPTSPTGPTQAFARTKGRKPPLPAAATRATSKKLPSADKRSGSLASVETSATEAHDPPTAPSTPVNTRDLLHDFRPPHSIAGMRTETPPPRKHDVRPADEHESGPLTPPQLHRGRAETQKTAAVLGPSNRVAATEAQKDENRPSSSPAIHSSQPTASKQASFSSTSITPRAAPTSLKFRLPGRHGQLSWAVVQPLIQLDVNSYQPGGKEASDYPTSSSPRGKPTNGSFSAAGMESAPSGPAVEGLVEVDKLERLETEPSGDARPATRCCCTM